MSLVNRIFGPAFRRVVLESDTELQAARKKYAIMMGCVGAVMGLSIVIMIRTYSIYALTYLALCVIPTALLLGYVGSCKSAPAPLLEWVIYGWLASICFSAYCVTQAGLPPVWHTVVLLLDMSLLTHLREEANAVIILVTCGAMVVSVVLETQRWTLPDITTFTRLCDCDDPPCRMGFRSASIRTLESMIVLTVDFLLTRNFAKSAAEEQASMQRTIDTVQRIALRLSEYDVDSVTEILDTSEKSLPREMVEALRALEANLRQYRPYLPDALFEQSLSRCSTVAAPSPGSSDATTIVFTDVRASTSIWEAVPDAMRRAMRIHNAEIRRVMESCGGYEVKTVGDSFMVAFEAPSPAINFALRVQEALVSVSWPHALSDYPLCVQRGGLWGGLTLRIGVNSGPVTVEENPITHRVDYFGHTVNVAARLEAVCVPGAVAVRSDMWNKMRPTCDESVSSPPEDVELKGVKGCVTMTSVWPLSLRGRRIDPLDHPDVLSRLSSKLTVASSVGSERSAMSVPRSHSHATLGTVSIDVSGSSDVATTLNHRLEIVMLNLTRNAGAVVAVLGSRVSIGWNATRPLDAHIPSAFRFASAVDRFMDCSVGIATGPVLSGHFGLSSQRFVTVVGEALPVSWALCGIAEEQGSPCLYACLQSGMAALPLSLREHLSLSKHSLPGSSQELYELLPDADVMSCHSL